MFFNMPIVNRHFDYYHFYIVSSGYWCVGQANFFFIVKNKNFGILIYSNHELNFKIE